MMDHTKYGKGYFLPPEDCFYWVKKDSLDHAPTWCSVDLRDGNQALIIPMSLDEKIKFFKLLVDVGFKEIEIGFPAASETEYEFCRRLIEEDLIPDDVTIQVLTQAREHIIRKTFDAIKGCKKAVVHVYNSTSVAQRQQVFKKSKEEILQIAVDGAQLLKDLAHESDSELMFEYSPESFTGTEVEYALEVCNAVIDVWQPTPDKKVIINLPVTVEMSMPHVYASQIEYMHKHLNRREGIVLSLHPHNDRGTGIADTELGLLAGADRVEGTLFGNGERTGNVDIITLAMNLYVLGVDPKLDFSDMPAIIKVYEEVTRMHVYERSPYAGKLVFAAFSGSHQDAIAKGFKYHADQSPDFWSVPYLLIDPTDIGRKYEKDVIRINSQSGKGGIGFVLQEYYGFELPRTFREEFGYYIKNISDHHHTELMPNEIKDIFDRDFLNLKSPIEVLDCHFKRNGDDYHASLSIAFKGDIMEIEGRGENGRLDAAANAFRE
ncbi:MAG: 2-isopropylmalate synthase, partial [Erysipelotrichaceae bacterium]|nr:2-isopropylmalate synthase [Erysipelotrichaceae bacterium]